MQQEKILVTGANGQIGSVLTLALRARYGNENVIATDIRQLTDNQHFALVNILDAYQLVEIVKKHSITQIYHLAAILSAKGEADPVGTWDINMSGLFNVLNTAKEYGVKKVFFPSSIAVFGRNAAKEHTSQNEICCPETVYGISKVAGENWCNYYFLKYGLDVRSLRYPGIIGHQTLPGGGTTDYAVEIYHKALKNEIFSCFLNATTRLPMIYMDDAIRATLEIMDADAAKIKIRTSYNLAGMSFAPKDVFEAIKTHQPDFQISYQPDFRQAIADSWTSSIDDSAARNDWGWNAKFDLKSMTDDMLKHLKNK